jgi:hypothetical protein
MQPRRESNYRPALVEGERVRLTRKDDRNFMNAATVKAVLPNPSQKNEHQWYDIRFDNGVWGRFLERYLDVVEEETKQSSAA